MIDQIKFCLGCIFVLLLGACSTTPANTGPTPFANPLPTPKFTLTPADQITPQPIIPQDVLRQIEPEEPPANAEVEILVDNLNGPVDFAFVPDGRLFFTEKATGNVRVVIDRQVLPDPVLTMPVNSLGEQGMLGIAIDPNYETNKFIWVAHTLDPEVNDGVKLNRVIRFREEANRAEDIQVALTTPNLIETDRHNLSNIVFGPDGMIYLTNGEETLPYTAQDITDPRGSILRFKPTIPLEAPEDNPFYDGDGPAYDGIYAYGFRNPYDMTFDPLSTDNKIFATGNGPSCDDEINLIRAGYNYGWAQDVPCSDDVPLDPEINTIPPMLSWSPTTSPTAIIVYTGDDFPEWYGDLFFCSFQDSLLHRLQLNESRDAIVKHTSINGMFCQVDLFNGPDGALYFLEGGAFADGRIKRLYARE